VLGRRWSLRKSTVRAAAVRGASALPVRASVPPVFEGLEDRRLMSADPFDAINRVQALPYVLEFNAQAGATGLHDREGEHIGLTRVQVNENGQAASYLPANLDLDTAAGVLRVTTPARPPPAATTTTTTR